jgi:hypothetical protein
MIFNDLIYAIDEIMDSDMKWPFIIFTSIVVLMLVIALGWEFVNIILY